MTVHFDNGVKKFKASDPTAFTPWSMERYCEMVALEEEAMLRPSPISMPMPERRTGWTSIRSSRYEEKYGYWVNRDADGNVIMLTSTEITIDDEIDPYGWTDPNP